jgi:hypothetical protein
MQRRRANATSRAQRRFTRATACFSTRRAKTLDPNLAEASPRYKPCIGWSQPKADIRNCVTGRDTRPLLSCLRRIIILAV